MKQATKKILITIAQIAALVTVALLLWYIAARAVNVDLIVPEPLAVIKLTVSLLGQGATYLALLSTLLRAVIAFAVSLVVASLCCMLIVVWRHSALCVNAVATFLRALPTIAVILVTMILFPSTVVPVVVAFLVVFPVIFSKLKRELEHSGNLLAVCDVYGVSAAKRVKYVFFPILRDEAMSIVGDELPLCIKVVIAGEVLAYPRSGIGSDMYVGKVNFDTAQIVALTLLTLIVCFTISGVVAVIKRKKI